MKKKTFSSELKKEVYEYHSDLHKYDKGIGGSIHKRVRERFNLTSDEVRAIIDEMKTINEPANIKP